MDEDVVRHKNSEGYADPTAGQALASISNAEKARDRAAEERIKTMTKIIKEVAELAGFEIVERIVFRDKESGKVYR